MTLLCERTLFITSRAVVYVAMENATSDLCSKTSFRFSVIMEGNRLLLSVLTIVLLVVERSSY